MSNALNQSLSCVIHGPTSAALLLSIISSGDVVGANAVGGSPTAATVNATSCVPALAAYVVTTSSWCTCSGYFQISFGASATAVLNPTAAGAWALTAAISALTFTTQ